MIDDRSRIARSVWIASACAFAVIATQVAGKATRDALFLSHFDISALPVVLIASAVLSIGIVLLAARAMSAVGPWRLVPPLFLASGLLVIGEWLLATRSPRLVAVLLYLHVAVLGSILVSGFWSIINEHFDPRTAKQNIGRIAGGAAFGGLVGGILTERIGAHWDILRVLPVLAGLQFACAVLLPSLRPATPSAEPLSLRALFASRPGEPAQEPALRVLRRVRYLRTIALFVLLANMATTLIDYLFKASAAHNYAGSTDLVRFFAAFYTVVSLVTLAVQGGLARRTLERFGIANTLSIRPAIVTVGGLVTLPFMGLFGLSILRGAEAVAQSSLFRSGYELLFTPVARDDKRRTKTIIDVGADRMGDILGGTLIRGVILLPVAVSNPTLMIIAAAISALGFGLARKLRQGYVRALEGSLIDRAHALDLAPDPEMRTMMMDSFAGVGVTGTIDRERLEELQRTPAPVGDTAAHTGAARAPAKPATTPTDPDVASLIELRSGDPQRIRAQLQHARSLSPVIAAQVISLLAWDEVTGWASRSLAKTAPAITGQLVDRLLDANEDFAIRRRVPAILSTCHTQRAGDGLMAALSDKRFEVRFQSGRALVRIHERLPSLVIDTDAVYASVMNETRIGKPLWLNQRLLDEPVGGDAFPPVDDALRARSTRSMEHVFTLLSLVLPRAPLQIAFKGLLTTDAVLRGTSLEYLESVVPRPIWAGLRPFLDDGEEREPGGRPGADVLDDLLRSSQSIELNLEEIRKRLSKK